MTFESFPRSGGDAFAHARTTAIGGCGANVALVLGGLGRAVRVIANVGADPWGAAARQMLSRAGVDTAAISVDRELPTHLTVILVAEDGERTIIGHRGASDALGPAPVAELLPTSTSTLVISGYALFGDVRATQAFRLGGLAHARGMATVLDLPTDLPDEVLHRARDMLPWVAYLVAGPQEIRQLAGITEPVDAAVRLASEQRSIVITMGERGCLSVGPYGFHKEIGFKARQVDATGAGDSFVAAFTAAGLDGLSMPDRLQAANAFGALAVTRHGAGPALPKPRDVLSSQPDVTRLRPSVVAWLEQKSATGGGDFGRRWWPASS